MKCTYCGAEIADFSAFCTECGAALEVSAAPETPVQPEPAPAPQPQYNNYAPQYQQPAKPEIPADYKPISPWGYLGYNILFSIPIVGFILLIVFSVGSGTNKNLKNYARSYWCALLVAVILVIVVVVISVVLGVSFSSMME